MMEAIVYKSTGSWYMVKSSDGKMYKARIKGKFKIADLTSTNPIAVGDYVKIVLENELEDGVMITEILDRKNYINRQSPHNKNMQHIVASNLDQSLLFYTIKNPKTSLGFLDRFIVTSEAYQITTVIVINKIDLYGNKEMEKLERMKEIYSPLGYKIICCSVEKKIGLNDLSDTLENKTSLLSGQSGVGKSSLINALFPELKLKTQKVSGWSGKGLHTTTFAEMFDFGKGKIIDTPGIREFGIFNLKKEELVHYFTEMQVARKDCQFNNCLHINEQNCGIKNKVETGEIAIERFESYLNILATIPETTYKNN